MKPRTAVDVGAPLENSRLDLLPVMILLNPCFWKEILSSEDLLPPETRKAFKV